jgi:hypothetical protein
MTRIARTAALWQVALALCTGAAARAELPRVPPPLPQAGQPLRAALNELRRGGLHIIYGSDLVPAHLLVVNEGSARTGADAAREILSPHGLDLVPGPASRWLVVRAAGEARSPASSTLATADVTLAEITVTAGHYPLGNVPGAQYLSKQEIARTPHIADDPLRVMRQLPGITGNDFSASMHVRGGARDETAVLLDGVRIHDPFHLKNLQGALGLIDSGIVEGIDVMTGGFGAEHGDRMSAIVSMRTLAPAEDGETTLGVSFANAFLRSRGPIADGRGHWLASVRRGYLDWLFKLIDSSGDFTPRYWDAFAQVDWAVGDATVLTGNVLLARDEMHYVETVGAQEQSLGWASSTYGWLTASTRWNRSLSSDTVFSWSGIDRRRENADGEDGISATVNDRRKLEFAAVRSDWRWAIAAQWLVKFGAELRHSSARYDYQLDSCLTDPFPSGPCSVDQSRSIVTDIGGESFGAYTSVRWKWHPRAIAEFGLRADRQTFAGFAENQLSPRLALRLQLADRSTLTLGWGRYFQSQQPDELQVEDGESRLARAEHADHLALSFAQDLTTRLALRAELYEKQYHRPRTRYENLFDAFETVPEAELDRIAVSPGSARIYGAGLTLDATPTDGVRVSLGYALQNARDQFVQGEAPRAWEQEHTLTGSLNWEVGHWNVSLFALSHSGWPTTQLSFDVSQGSTGIVLEPDTGPRNDERLPRYTRLDFRVSREHRLPSGDLGYYFELYNALDRSNVCCVDGLQFYPDQSGGLQARPQYDDWLPRLPSFGFTWTFR